MPAAGGNRVNAQKVLHGEVAPDVLPKGRSAKQCAHCKQWFSLPNCHAVRHHCCTAECSKLLREARSASRSRACDECGEVFVPRLTQIRDGIGRFCSNSCSTRARSRHESFAVARAKATETYRARAASGLIIYPRGPENPRWKGGPKAARARAQADGRMLRRLKEYRSRNPDKVREWTQSRSRRKAGRLPRGTISRLFKLQRGKCVYCLQKLGKSYHADHITPLMKGGQHVAYNIQLLCGSCNVRKWAHDPIVFAQANGRLL